MRWLCSLIFFACCVPASAAVVATMTDGKATIHIYNEPCKLTQQITNLPMRATWTEDGKTSEGCFTIRGSILLTYWAIDKTLGVIPVASLQMVREL
jgi:hypothetical protein